MWIGLIWVTIGTKGEPSVHSNGHPYSKKYSKFLEKLSGY
jgi:hypothetical protein